MHMNRKLAFGSLLVFVAGLAYAADQTILGNSLTVKNPSAPEKRKITVKAKETGSPNTMVGNPVAAGGTLTVSVGGATPSTQLFLLPQGISAMTGRAFWSGDAVKGFKYKDPKGEQSAVKAAQIKKSPNGTFSIKTTVAGKLGPVGVTPPNPGTNGCVVLKLTGGDTYSVKFSVGDGVVMNKGATLYKHKKVFVQGSCVFISSTTSSTTSTSTTSTTSTTLYGSPSRAFVDRVRGLLD